MWKDKQLAELYKIRIGLQFEFEMSSTLKKEWPKHSPGWGYWYGREASAWLQLGRLGNVITDKKTRNGEYWANI